MAYYFSSESVSEGHPDKLCDQVSDAILDEILRQDSNSRCAAEVFATTGLVLVGGEIGTNAVFDTQTLVRDVIREIGYTSADYGLDADSCAVLSCLHGQSVDIAQGVNKGEGLFKELGAGDQGMMFGYACHQTDVYMPLPIYLSHQLTKRLAELRKTKAIAYLRPDAKAQVTVEYEGRVPKRVDTVVVSTQHDPEATHEQIVSDVKRQLIVPVIGKYMDEKTKVFVNPTGRFVIGGPHGDTGLTGRKIIVDTYGGWAGHGGGAFSGKDATKVDRSGAYMARYVAKNLVAAGVADELELQLAYAIGMAEPISIHIDTKGTSKLSTDEIVSIIEKHFNLTPEGIIDALDLKKPTFKQAAAYGHFGRADIDLTWEQLNKVEAIRSTLSAKQLVS